MARTGYKRGSPPISGTGTVIASAITLLSAALGMSIPAEAADPPTGTPPEAADHQNSRATKIDSFTWKHRIQDEKGGSVHQKLESNHQKVEPDRQKLESNHQKLESNHEKLEPDRQKLESNHQKLESHQYKERIGDE